MRNRKSSYESYEEQMEKRVEARLRRDEERYHRMEPIIRLDGMQMLGSDPMIND